MFSNVEKLRTVGKHTYWAAPERYRTTKVSVEGLNPLTGLPGKNAIDWYETDLSGGYSDKPTTLAKALDELKGKGVKVIGFERTRDGTRPPFWLIKAMA